MGQAATNVIHTNPEPAAGTPAAGSPALGVTPPPAAGAAPDPAPKPPGGNGASPAPTVLGRGGTQVPPESVAARIDRERRRLLREEYGTDDMTRVAQIREQRKSEAERFKALSTAEEARQREAMTAQQRLEADLAKERERVVALETQIRELKEAQVIDRQTAQLTEIASKHIDPSLAEWALSRFQRHLREMPVEQIKRLTPRAIDRWFAKFAEDNPRARKELPTGSAKAPDQAPARVEPAPEKQPRRVPLATTPARAGGAPKPRAPGGPAPAGTVGGKTLKPGLPNSMTRAEVQEFMKSKGMRPY